MKKELSIPASPFDPNEQTERAVEVFRADIDRLDREGIPSENVWAGLAWVMIGLIVRNAGPKAVAPMIHNLAKGAKRIIKGQLN